MKRDAGQTKELILNTATELFAIHGYDGLRVDEIALKAKVNKATIYYHFKDKNFIFETILIEMTDKIFNEIEIREKGLTDSFEQLEAFFDAIGYIVENYRDLAKIMMHELSMNGKNLSLEVKEKFFNILKHLIGIVQKGIEEGKFKNISPILLHTTFLGGLNYYFSLKETVNESFPLEFEDKPHVVLKEMVLSYLQK